MHRPTVPICIALCSVIFVTAHPTFALRVKEPAEGRQKALATALRDPASSGLEEVEEVKVFLRSVFSGPTGEGDVLPRVRALVELLSPAQRQVLVFYLQYYRQYTKWPRTSQAASVFGKPAQAVQTIIDAIILKMERLSLVVTPFYLYEQPKTVRERTQMRRPVNPKGMAQITEVLQTLPLTVEWRSFIEQRKYRNNDSIAVASFIGTVVADRRAKDPTFQKLRLAVNDLRESLAFPTSYDGIYTILWQWARRKQSLAGGTVQRVESGVFQWVARSSETPPSSESHPVGIRTMIAAAVGELIQSRLMTTTDGSPHQTFKIAHVHEQLERDGYTWVRSHRLSHALTWWHQKGYVLAGGTLERIGHGQYRWTAQPSTRQTLVVNAQQREAAIGRIREALRRLDEVARSTFVEMPLLVPVQVAGVGPTAAAHYAETLAVLSLFLPETEVLAQRFFVLTKTSEQAAALSGAAPLLAASQAPLELIDHLKARARGRSLRVIYFATDDEQRALQTAAILRQVPMTIDRHDIPMAPEKFFLVLFNALTDKLPQEVPGVNMEQLTADLAFLSEA